MGPRDWHVGTWQFPAEAVPAYWNNNAPLMTFNGAQVARQVAPGPAAFLRAYQRYGFTPGPALGAMVALGAVAVLLTGRRAGDGQAGSGPAGDDRAGDDRIRTDCALLVTAGMALLVIPSATVCFDYRYLLPTLVLLPPAAALGWHRTTLARARPVHRPRHLRRR
ncbi:putative membrane protein [Candidatus Protofrankia californiensis]|uniref:Putative membrane protein n=1 Tax=Candidatus Protofrankia californiensis TaxID=1839754 RepID=A0A1C3P1Z6_9ACTN|nr:putative membrane protein [Candidatus Protofrankia californiensis]